LLWGKQYKGALQDLLVLEEQIIKETAETLRRRLTRHEEQTLGKQYTQSSKAFQLYIQGRHHWRQRTEEGLKKSVWYFQEAISKDPNYALAYSGLSDAWATLASYGHLSDDEGIPLAKDAAAKALELDDALAEAHASMAAVYGRTWNGAVAEREFLRAIELNPNYATAHHWYGTFLLAMGKIDEAIRQVKIALILDPLALNVNASLAEFYLMKGETDMALRQARKYEAAPLMQTLILAIYETEKHYSLAIDQFEKAVVARGISSQEATRVRIELEKAFAASGEKGYWTKRVEFALAKRDFISSPTFIAGLYAHLSQTDQVFVWLEKAFQEHDYPLLYIKAEPDFSKLRNDPRFVDLLRRMGLPLQ